jgi:Zn finger protein HypA/HybF involved in hydrogenase expression
VPVLSAGAPDVKAILEGVSIDISRRGVGILTAHGKAPANDVVIGLEADDGTMHFASAHIRHARPVETGWTIGTEFVEPSQDLLRPANVALRLDPASFQFKTALRTDCLQQWAMAGVLRPRLVDWVQLCPHCEALPTFRYGCPGCGSAHIATSQLIHHFACAHVGLVVEFEQHDLIVCPKCRARNLVVGADFEYATGPYRCLDCGWSDGELMHIAQCLRCPFRFPAVDAIERELIEFYVHQLDPLALVASD